MTEVLFCKPIRPVSHQWHFRINEKNKKGGRKELMRGYPRPQEWPNKAALLWSQRPRFSKISRSTDRIASWALLRWESVLRWRDLGHATTQSQFSAVFHHHLQAAIRAGYSIPMCSWKHLAFLQHWKQGYGGNGTFGKKTFWPSSTPTGAHQDRAESELAPAEPLDTE